MPFYEYECRSCKFYTEVMQKISDPPLVKCPSCGKRSMQKLVSAPVFRLKGSGWYETDFKSDKEGQRNLAVEREEPKPAVEESKAEAKKAPATESAAKPSEPKAPGTATSATASVTTSASAARPRAAAARKSAPPAAKASARPAPRAKAKAKPAARGKAAKRGSRR
jgi:putative FmdB family regulatory protein